MNVAVNITWGIAVTKDCLSMTANNNQGMADLGFRLSKENLRFAEESGDTRSKAEAHTFYGCPCYSKRLLDDDAEWRFLEAIAFREKFNFMSESFSNFLFRRDLF
jgi:hypothetical protein